MLLGAAIIAVGSGGSPLLAQQSKASAHCAELVSGGQFGRIEVCASSVLTPQSGNRYGPRNVFDGDPATAWVEAGPGDGQGQWIEYRFEWPMRVQSFEILAGYAKDRKAHVNNARPRELRVIVDGEFIETVRLDDTMELQRLRLSEPVEAGRLRLQVVSSYPGRKWQDLAISEFYVDLEELN